MAKKRKKIKRTLLEDVLREKKSILSIDRDGTIHMDWKRPKKK